MPSAEVIAATVQSLADITARWNDAGSSIQHLEAQIEALQGNIAGWNVLREGLQKQAQTCYDFATLQGFDLNVEWAKAQAIAHVHSGAADMIQAPSKPPPPPQSVREFVLDEALRAYPEPVQSSGLRLKLKDEFGQVVHDKTMGMTLYRLSKEDPPKMRRRGRHDWYYVHPDDLDATIPLNFEEQVVEESF